MAESIPPIGTSPAAGPVLPKAFDQFVGDTFFRQMLKSLRSTTGKPAFLHGGQAEEIFQSQLDELLITDMVEAARDSFSDDLFKQQFPDHTAQNQSPSTSSDSARHQITKVPIQNNNSKQSDNHIDVNA